jgi:hypothetical protein
VFTYFTTSFVDARSCYALASSTVSRSVAGRRRSTRVGCLSWIGTLWRFLLLTVRLLRRIALTLLRGIALTLLRRIALAVLRRISLALLILAGRRCLAVLTYRLTHYVSSHLSNSSMWVSYLAADHSWADHPHIAAAEAGVRRIAAVARIDRHQEHRNQLGEACSSFRPFDRNLSRSRQVEA